MTETEGRLTESNANINTTNEIIPARRHNITMELCMFVIMLSMSLTGVAVSNIILYRTCLHSLGHSESECIVFLSLDKNNGTQELEKEVQKYATFISTVRSVIESLAPAILTLFLGVWSDRYGRKPLIIWPLFGSAMTGMLLVVYSMLNDLGPWWYILTAMPYSTTYQYVFLYMHCILGLAMTGILLVVYSMLNSLGPWWFILTAIPYSLTGGFTIIFTGAYCYISDVTTTEKRSLRMTILEAAVSAGSVVGSLLSSHVLRAVGNIYLLLIGAALNVLVYAFTIICFKESLVGAVQGGVSTVLDFQLVKEMVRNCFKSRPNRGRAQILLLTFANSLSIFILYGMFNLEYMYAREKLHWALKNYTLYSAINTTISFFGGFLGVIVLQKFLRISDLAFANIAFLSLIAEYVIKALAVTSWHMYLAAGVAMFKGLSAPLIRSVLTKILPLEDIAKVFALMSAIEGICPLISPPIYNSLYEFTLSSFPASIYVLSCGVAGICAVFVSIVQFYRRNSSSPYLRLNEETVTE